MLIVWTNVAQALLLLPLLAVGGVSGLWIIYLVCAVQSAPATL
jgi:hypothetical protein